MVEFKAEVIRALATVIPEQFALEIPQNPAFGDFALPCFKLSKKPHEIQQAVKFPSFIEKTEIRGLYLNFFIKKDVRAAVIVKSILRAKEKYGTLSVGKGKKALIEHTSINPNASPHLGRARNAIIGDVITRVIRFAGFKTDVHYFVNDVGKQIAMLVFACKGKTPSFQELLQKYVDFNAKLAANPALEQEVFALLSKFEAGDKKTIAHFQRIVRICLTGQTKILKAFGITFDVFDYESKYLLKKETKSMLKELEATGKVVVDEQGRKVISLDGFSLAMENPILPLTRADGTSLYMLRDLAYTREKNAKCAARNVLVLGEDQKLYFQQLKAILSLLQEQAPEVVHYSYVLLKEGKMSTRQGTVVLLEDFMREAAEKALQEIQKRKLAKGNKQKLAKIIGFGAVKFAFLRVSADKNIVFEWERALTFEGESGPYVQYAYARACSILKRARRKGKLDFALIKSAQEQALIAKCGAFPQVVADTVSTLQVHVIANYALDLAQTFNEFYHQCPVLHAPGDVKHVRIALVQAFVITLRNALHLLGIEAPTSM